MKIQANDTEYEVHFQQSKGTGMTECHFRVGNSNPIVSFALCSRKDTFRPMTGKKIALLKAMKTAGLTKWERFLVWMEYFEQTNQTRCLVNQFGMSHVPRETL